MKPIEITANNNIGFKDEMKNKIIFLAKLLHKPNSIKWP